MKLYKVGLNSYLNMENNYAYKYKPIIDVTYTTHPETIDVNNPKTLHAYMEEVEIDDKYISGDKKMKAIAGYSRSTKKSGIQSFDIIPLDYDIEKEAKKLRLKHMYSKEYSINKDGELIIFDDVVYSIRTVKIDNYY